MRLASRYGPPLAVMGLIFFLSAQPDLSTNLGTWDLVLRKLAHITIYAVLWLTVARALDWRRPLLTTLIAVLYAASDEVHQTFVTDRHGTPVDVMIDCLGMAIAALAWPRRWGGRPLTASRAR
jgi:VanZ family protein